MEWVVWDVSNMWTNDIDLQSVADKMVREMSLEVREKAGKIFVSNF